jgi:cytochrome bd-type quinol oxidase subunit 1
MKRWLPILGGGAVVVVIVFAILFSIWGVWPVVRDIVIVATALISLLLLGFLGFALMNLAITIRNVKRELTPVLEALQATSQSVSDTARVASDLGVAPTVRTASVLVGVAEAAGILLGRGHARSRAQKRAQRRQEVERELTARGELNGHR